MFVKLFLLVGLAASIDAQSYRDLYQNVGKCTDKLIGLAMKDFNVEKIANSGLYTYVYSSLVSDDCAVAEIHGSSNIGYEGSITFYDHGKVKLKQYYRLNNFKDGVFDEILVDANGKATDYKFKLVVLGYRPDLNVFFYARCAKDGTGETDSRSIVTNSCFRNLKARNEHIRNLLKIDAGLGLKGKLLPANKCKK